MNKYMIAKGFRDEDGNIIEVPAAGVRYNAALNATAVGSKTKATGFDQLVFGRKNIEDANKAEIVGGGKGDVSKSATGKEDVVRLLESLNINDNITIVTNTGGVETSKKWKKIATNVADAISYLNRLFGDNYRFDLSMLSQFSDEDLVMIGMKAYLFDEYNQPADPTRFDWVSSWHAFTNHLVFITANGKAWEVGGTSTDASDNKLLHITNAYDRNIASAGTDSTITPANLRTLDWEGNEVLAGGLTAGGDVKCDDGEGNELSMRAIAEEAKGKADAEHTHTISDVTGLQDALNGKMGALKEIFIDCDDSDDADAWEIRPDAAGEAAFRDALVWGNNAPRLVIVNITKGTFGTTNIKTYRTIGSIHATAVEVNVDAYDLTAEIYVDGHVFTRTGEEMNQEQTWGQGLTLASNDIFTHTSNL